jgi:uncharacterized protein DUF6883
MKLPNAENVIVDDAKVRDFLLSLEHPVGRFKARVFLAAGYQRSAWQRLRDDLLAMATVIDVKPTHTDQFGRRFAGVGAQNAPSGNPLLVVAVWLISSEAAGPRLITA